MVCISGFSACTCGGEVGSGCCRCSFLRHTRTWDTTTLPQWMGMPGEVQSSPTVGTAAGVITYWGISWRQHPGRAALPPKICVASANRHAGSYPSSRLHVPALKRQFPPLQPLLTHKLLHLSSKPCALLWLNSGDGMKNWSWLLQSGHSLRIM